MDCRSLSRRFVVLAWVAALVASAPSGDAACVADPSIESKSAGVHPRTNRQEGRRRPVHKPGGRGPAILRRKRCYLSEPSGDYVWGRPVASSGPSAAGRYSPVPQRRVRGQTPSTRITKRRVSCALRVPPHHMAIVSEVGERGRVVAILHQNVGAPDAAEATKQVVQEASIRPESLQAGSSVAIFRLSLRATTGEIRHGAQSAGIGEGRMGPGPAGKEEPCGVDQ